MRRTLILLVASLAAVVLVVGLVSSAAGATPRAKLQLRKTDAGTILVNRHGFTLYAFTTDRRNYDSCAKQPGCLSAWPSVKTGARALAGRGVKSKLIGTITLKDGTRQVTYAGHPLYTYIADRSPGQTSFINILQFGGRWPAINAAGREVK